MPRTRFKIGSTDFVLRKAGTDYIIEVGTSKKGQKSSEADRTLIKTPGPYMVEKLRGRYYVKEVRGSKGQKRTVFVAPGRKISTSSSDRFEDKLTKAFASAVKSAT